MIRQCSSCGGFCKKSGCERESVKSIDSATEIERLKAEIEDQVNTYHKLCLAISRLVANAEEVEFSDMTCVMIPIDDYHALFDLINVNTASSMICWRIYERRRKNV